VYICVFVSYMKIGVGKVKLLYGHKWKYVYACTNILSTFLLSCHSTSLYHLAWQHFIHTVMAVTVTASIGYGYSAFEKHFVTFATHTQARAPAQKQSFPDL